MHGQAGRRRRVLPWRARAIFPVDRTRVGPGWNTGRRRGHDAIVLARTRAVHEVASLLWTGRFDALDAPTEMAGARTKSHAGAPGPTPHLPFIPRAQAMLAAASGRDPQACDLRAEAVVQTGWRILRRLTEVVAGAGAYGAALDAALARGWRVPQRDVDVVRAALILCADHELNVSSFTARSVGVPILN